MFTRFLSAATGGGVITLGLFWVMHVLIVNQPQVIADARERGTLVLEEVRDDSDLQVMEQTPQFEDLKEPIEPVPERRTPDYAGPRVAVSLPPQESAGYDRTPIEHSGFGDGPLVTIVRVQPTYPIRASERGLEGFVTVEFDVLADGTVSNVRVIESSHSLFERPAIEAAEKFRFKPRVVDGIAQPSYGLRNRFTFEMERG